MVSKRSEGKDRIILFGRYPVPGKTKTRLIPGLGPAGAAELQRRLTEKILNALKPLGLCSGVEIEFCQEGGTRAGVKRWLGKKLLYSHQVPGDLGDRMYAAFLGAFEAGCQRVVLLGTDIPGVKARHLEEALRALEDRGLVLGPSTDGGYWLLGLKHPVDLFRKIRWGTEDVLSQTLAAAGTEGLSVYQLDPMTDVDRVEDLHANWSDLGVTGPYLSVIIPALDESSGIEKTVQSARDVDAEVIVVDGGSRDDTMAGAARAGARVERSSRGRALQQNRGAALARGEVLLFLHADTCLPRGYVGHVFETLMDPRIVVGAFRFRADRQGCLMRLVAFLTNIRARYFHLPYGDQALFIRRALFESIGGFPETAIAEDLLLVKRLAGRGRIGIAPAEAVTSARRWDRFGVARTTIINQMILAGCLVGFSPGRLEPLYRRPHRKH